MRITKDATHHPSCSESPGCGRRYCADHRLIYFQCATGIMETEGDYSIPGGTRSRLWVTGECPECEQEYRARRAREAWQRAQEKSNGPHSLSA